jgi:hypothetical protein
MIAIALRLRRAPAALEPTLERLRDVARPERSPEHRVSLYAITQASRLAQHRSNVRIALPMIDNPAKLLAHRRAPVSVTRA